MLATIAARRRLTAAAILLALTIVTIPQVFHSLRFNDSVSLGWTPARLWIESADCARATHSFLTLIREHKLVPLADEEGGDDPGHALALDLYSLATGRHVTAASINVLNTAINFTGIVILAGLMFALGLPLSCLSVLTIGAAIANQFHAASPHPAQLGCACLAAIFPIALLGFPLSEAKARTVRAWLFVGLMGLAAASLFREAIGLMGLVASIGALAARLFLPRRNLVTAAGLALLVMIAYQAPLFVLQARNDLYGLHASKMLERHGAWHNLYLGLGAVPNSLGVEWLDGNAFQAAQKVDPKVQFASIEYFSIIRDQYANLVASHPLEVARIYLAKLVATLNTPLYIFDIKRVLALLLLAAWFAAHRAMNSGIGGHACHSTLAVSGLFTCFFIGQAMLFHYDMQYLFPIKLFLVMCAGAAADLFLTASAAQRVLLTQAPEPIAKQ